MKKKWLRRILVLAAVFVLLPGLTCALLPGYVERTRREQILREIGSAQTVRVEEFDDPKNPKKKHELTAAERATLLKILPSIVPKWYRLVLELCFVPRHRIVARSANGEEFTIEICFECDLVQHTGSEIYDLPKAGRAAVLGFLREIDIPCPAR